MLLWPCDKSIEPAFVGLCPQYLDSTTFVGALEASASQGVFFCAAFRIVANHGQKPCACMPVCGALGPGGGLVVEAPGSPRASRV